MENNNYCTYLIEDSMKDFAAADRLKSERKNSIVLLCSPLQCGYKKLPT